MWDNLSNVTSSSSRCPEKSRWPWATTAPRGPCVRGWSRCAQARTVRCVLSCRPSETLIVLWNWSSNNTYFPAQIGYIGQRVAFCKHGVHQSHEHTNFSETNKYLLFMVEKRKIENLAWQIVLCKYYIRLYVVMLYPFPDHNVHSVQQSAILQRSKAGSRSKNVEGWRCTGDSVHSEG